MHLLSGADSVPVKSNPSQFKSFAENLKAFEARTSCEIIHNYKTDYAVNLLDHAMAFIISVVRSYEMSLILSLFCFVYSYRYISV